jgi:hypothetical protein
MERLIVTGTVLAEMPKHYSYFMIFRNEKGTGFSAAGIAAPGYTEKVDECYRTFRGSQVEIVEYYRTLVGTGANVCNHLVETYARSTARVTKFLIEYAGQRCLFALRLEPNGTFLVRNIDELLRVQREGGHPELIWDEEKELLEGLISIYPTIPRASYVDDMHELCMFVNPQYAAGQRIVDRTKGKGRRAK